MLRVYSCVCLLIFFICTEAISQQGVRKIRHVNEDAIKNDTSLIGDDIVVEVNASIIDVNDILNVATGHYRKGIYKTFEEFRRNSPSIPYKGKLRPTNEYQFNVSVNSYILYLDDQYSPLEYGEEIWGISDGTHVFIARHSILNYKFIFDRVLFIGRYVYIKTFIPSSNASYNMTGGVSPSINGNNVGNGVAGRKFIDINDGSVFDFSKKNFEEILIQDAELWSQYNKDKNSKLREYYFVEYFKIHKEGIVPLY